jgi:antitoxin component YwqK of YwqJK toxin-antitoxin module
MKYIFLIVCALSLLFTSCSEKKVVKIPLVSNSIDTLLAIPNTTVDKSELHYDNKVSLWTLNNQQYSGYAVSFYEDSILKEKVGILNGKKENQAIRWYLDGHFKQVAHYHKGKLHGEKKVWSSYENHIILSQLNYRLGKAHGEQKQWYKSGELHKKLNLNMGKEEGIQQAFRENGDLYANYEAKDGRIFGLRKTALCFGLEEEKLRQQK